MRELLKSLRLENIFYVNFEDNRLEGINSGDFSRIVELYKNTIQNRKPCIYSSMKFRILTAGKVRQEVA
jgi:aromatic ring-opening dioxygenase LigB subunit